MNGMLSMSRSRRDRTAVSMLLMMNNNSIGKSRPSVMAMAKTLNRTGFVGRLLPAGGLSSLVL